MARNCRKGIHGTRPLVEFDQKSCGGKQTGHLRSRHESADRDDGTHCGTIESEQAHVQGEGKRTGPGHGSRLQGQRSQRHRSRKLQTTVGANGEWSVPAATLPDETYTAVATEPSAIGNAEGESAPTTFTIFTRPPTVTIEQPSERSKENQPTFKGTASEPGTVTVHIYEGSGTTGPEVTSLSAAVSGHEWRVAPTTALKDGTYTAVATEPSAIGNESGTSEATNSFVIYTKPPKVECEPLQGKTPNTTPAFNGTSNEPGTVHRPHLQRSRQPRT